MYAIAAHGVSKVYRMYRRPVDRLKEAVLRKPYHEAFDSLKDVSLAVACGSSLGIIGENGAGKSTLLKILAGTLTPSSGHVERRGRVAALLELGTGFHQEFTGRQNIYLNASLQGLSEKEIREREPEIVDFAELGRFIDQPIKTYSSGMVMRLAFSTATSIDPDTLIVDEALSVGDQYFQRKCVDRMARFRQKGKTILFCSHSMYLVGELCESTVWLENGRTRSSGPTAEVSAAYLAHLEEKEQSKREGAAAAAPGSAAPPEVVIEDVSLVDRQGNTLDRMQYSAEAIVRIRTRCTAGAVSGHLGAALNRPDGRIVFATSSKEAGLEPIQFSGRQVTELVFPSLPFTSGAYYISAVVTDCHALHPIHDVITATFPAVSSRPEFGMLHLEHEWRLPSRPG